MATKFAMSAGPVVQTFLFTGTIKMPDKLMKAESIKMKPMLHCEGSDCVDGVQVGDEKELIVKAKCTAMSEDEYDGKKNKTQRWEIIKIKSQGDDEDSDEEPLAAFARKAQRNRTE
jgi:hypothetical protein